MLSGEGRGHWQAARGEGCWARLREVWGGRSRAAKSDGLRSLHLTASARLTEIWAGRPAPSTVLYLFHDYIHMIMVRKNIS